MCGLFRVHDYLPETRKEMGSNIIRLAHWLTVVSWGVALQAYMANDQVSWENLFALALGFGGLGILGFIWGARTRDKARLDMRQMKREKV